MEFGSVQQKLKWFLLLFLVILIVIFGAWTFKITFKSSDPMEGWDNVNVELEAIVSISDDVLSESLDSSDGRNQQATSSSTGLVHLNKADVFELELIPGIGPVKAQAIVEYRKQHGDFSEVEEVLLVNGIGPVTFENMRSHITLED